MGIPLTASDTPKLDAPRGSVLLVSAKRDFLSVSEGCQRQLNIIGYPNWSNTRASGVRVMSGGFEKSFGFWRCVDCAVFDALSEHFGYSPGFVRCPASISRYPAGPGPPPSASAAAGETYHTRSELRKARDHMGAFETRVEALRRYKHWKMSSSSESVTVAYILGGTRSYAVATTARHHGQ